MREELSDFAEELNSEKTTCDCCSLKKWDDFGQGKIGVTARSVAVKLAKLHSLMEDDIKTKSKVVKREAWSAPSLTVEMIG